MMNQTKTQKVFVQYMYCPLCRSNHKRGKKHVLTEKHQQIVANVLKKFSKKIEEAKNSLEKPTVKDILWPDADSKFWCYFCQIDVNRHKVNKIEMGDSIIIVHGGMLEHIVREDHVKSTTTFLKNNRVDMKRTPEFVLTSQTYIKFLGNVEKAVSVFFRDKANLLKQMSSHIRVQTALQQQITAAGLLDQSTKSQEKYRYRQDKAHTVTLSNHNEDGQRKKTSQAFGEGLTAVDRSNEDDSFGNIYTNAVPPWMMPDAEDTEDNAEIGPTMKDLEKHRKLEKKAKLPATRVGAKFDRSADLSDSWMPSFGGVWHHSRRTDSLKLFHRKQMGKHKLPQTSAPHQMSGQGSNPFAAGSFVYPETLELTHHDEAPVNKTPKTTSTVHSPWNSYISSPRTTIQSQLSTSLLDFQLPTPLEDHSSVSKGPSYLTVPVPDSHSLNLPDTPSSQISVKPYVSKRRKQNSSTSKNFFLKAAHASINNFTYPDTSYPPPHPGMLFSHHGHSTTDPHPRPDQYSNPQRTASVDSRWTDQQFKNGFDYNRESYSKSNKLSKAPIATTASVQQSVRLISTPLLQNNKDKR